MKLLISQEDGVLLDQVIERLGMNAVGDRAVEKAAKLIVALHDYGKGQASAHQIAVAMGEVQCALALLTRFVGQDRFEGQSKATWRGLRAAVNNARLQQQLEDEMNGNAEVRE